MAPCVSFSGNSCILICLQSSWHRLATGSRTPGRESEADPAQVSHTLIQITYKSWPQRSSPWKSCGDGEAAKQQVRIHWKLYSWGGSGDLVRTEAAVESTSFLNDWASLSRIALLTSVAWGRSYKRCPKHSLPADKKQGKKTRGLTFAAWITRTLLDSTKADRSERWTTLVGRDLACYNVDIAALSKTQLADKGQLSKIGGVYTFLCSDHSSEERHDAGYGFTIKSTMCRN